MPHDTIDGPPKGGPHEKSWLNTVHIHPATVGDHLDLRAAIVVLQDFEHGLQGRTNLGELVADGYLAWMLARAKHEGVVLVALVDGGFAGFCAGWVEQDESPAELPERRRHGFVSDVCVMPAYRGRGIAALLLAEIEGQLARHGILQLRLAVLAGNDGARRCYERAGYVPFVTVYEKRVGEPVV